MRATALVLVTILLAASTAAAVSPSLVHVVPGGLDPVLRMDPDGGRTLVALLEDGVGGSYRHIPASDAGLATFSDVLLANGVLVDPLLYGGELKELGVFAHSFTLGGTPYLTLGAYARTQSQGLVRIPSVMLENVEDLQGATLLAASIVGDDALPLVAEAVPHSYGLIAPDAGPLMGVAILAVAVVVLAPLLVVGTVAATDASQPAVNIPPEAYPALFQMGADAFLLFFPLFFGPTGLPAPADSSAPYAEDWVDRPEVRAWTLRKTAAASEVWKGAYLERTGHSNGGPAGAFEGTKRVESGLALRRDTATTHVAGIYLQTDAERQASSTAQHARVRYTLGATAADAADVPLAALEMEETRSDSAGHVRLFPASQRNDWRVGVMVDGQMVPLAGARTESSHRFYTDTTNQGAPIAAIETERITSVGAYANGEYVPLLGARYWGERNPAELYALTFALAGGGPGDQVGGDVEVSAGTFLLGAYVPLVGARIDDDFAGHLFTYRSMVSAGLYPLGAFEPVLGTTYDGERPFVVWALGHAGSSPDGRTRWQTSAGAFALDAYHPVLGTRFAPATHGANGASQESYQVGVYPLAYGPLVPLASADYAGDASSAAWAQMLATGAQGGAREGAWDMDAVAYGVDGGAIPVAGVRYRPGAPDLSAQYEMHLLVGVWVQGAFVPLAGASLATDAPLLVWVGSGGDAETSVGAYRGDAYEPAATVDTATAP